MGHRHDQNLLKEIADLTSQLATVTDRNEELQGEVLALKGISDQLLADNEEFDEKLASVTKQRDELLERLSGIADYLYPSGAWLGSYYLDAVRLMSILSPNDEDHLLELIANAKEGG